MKVKDKQGGDVFEAEITEIDSTFLVQVKIDGLISVGHPIAEIYFDLVEATEDELAKLTLAGYNWTLQT